MNILVTGADGQLGKCLRNVVSNSRDEYLFTNSRELDITDSDAVRKTINDNNIEIIINCAAYTNVDKAEDEPRIAEKVNAGAVRNLAEAIKEVDGTLIHISTDYVFGGDTLNTPIIEEQSVNPLGVYGKTKLKGEKIIETNGCRSIIIRTSWLYSEYGNNFVKTILTLLSTRTGINVVFDQTGSPTYARDLAEAIFRIIESRKFEGNEGIYNYSNEGVCTWFDFAKTISLKNENKCKVLPCRSSEFPSKVKRPSYSVLDKTKFKKTFDIEIPYWTESLSKCLNRLSDNEK